MKVVFFGFGMLEIGGGFEHYLIDTAASMAQQYPSVKFSVVTASPELTEKYYKFISKLTLSKYNNSQLYREDTESIKKRLNNVNYRNFHTFKELKEIILNASVVYAKNEVLELLLLNKYRARNNPPIVIGVHTPVYYPYTPTLSSKLHNLVYTGFFYKWLLRNVAVIKVNNEDDSQYFKNKFNIDNVGVLHHGFKTIDKKAKYSRKGELNIMFAGRLTEQKGVDILVEVINEINAKRDIKGIHFKIAGSGNDKEEDMIRSLNDRYINVEYLGHVPQDNMQKLYEWADVAIIPSKFETLNKVAVETAIHAKIAISSDIPGPREVIEHKSTGFLVEVDSSKFVDHIIMLHELKRVNLSNFKSIGTAAQNKIKNEFSISKTNRSLMEVFKLFSKSD